VQHTYLQGYLPVELSIERLLLPSTPDSLLCLIPALQATLNTNLLTHGVATAGLPTGGAVHERLLALN
jgi:hypothetical protein